MRTIFAIDIIYIKKQPDGLIVNSIFSMVILSSSAPRLSSFARDIRLLRVVEVRGKAEDADHERSSEPARNGVEWCAQ